MNEPVWRRGVWGSSKWRHFWRVGRKFLILLHSVWKVTPWPIMFSFPAPDLWGVYILRFAAYLQLESWNPLKSQGWHSSHMDGNLWFCFVLGGWTIPVDGYLWFFIRPWDDRFSFRPLSGFGARGRILRRIYGSGIYGLGQWGWYCWWKKSYTSWYFVNIPLFTWCRISSINSSNYFLDTCCSSMAQWPETSSPQEPTALPCGGRLHTEAEMRDVPGCGLFAAFFFVGKPVYLIEARICILSPIPWKREEWWNNLSFLFFFCYDIYMIFIIFVVFCYIMSWWTPILFNFYQQWFPFKQVLTFFPRVVGQLFWFHASESTMTKTWLH